MSYRVVTQYKPPEHPTTIRANIHASWVKWIDHMYAFTDEAPEDFRSAFIEAFEGNLYSVITLVLADKFTDEWKQKVRIEHGIWD